MAAATLSNNANMITGRVSRPVKKSERSRTIKSTGSGGLFHSGEPGIASFSTAEEVISFLDAFINFYGNKSAEQDLQSIVVTLCANLKVYGPQLESLYKDQLDRGFYHLRNASRDNQLDVLSRLHLLEVIELRASRWNLPNDPLGYYQQKLAQVEDSQIVEYANLSSSPVMGTQGSPQSPPPPASSSSGALLLQSGEVLKSSGKYTAAAKVPGKNFVKDEVVIRNADSGKVMGIKGRRVHLIEEISDTVISFQRVNPGAKERLVQITGASEDNIERARVLMEETIRRNASPVRPAELPASPLFEPANASAIELDENRNAAMKMNRSASMIEGSADKFLYTVNVGGQYIKITGNNLNLVQTAKLVLDEYFSSTVERERNPSENSTNSSYGEVAVPTSPQISPRQSDTPLSPREVRRSYSRDYLLLLGNSPFSLSAPEQFETIVGQFPDVARKDKEPFNVEQYMKQFPDKFFGENIVIGTTD